MDELGVSNIDQVLVQFNPEAVFSLNLILALVMFGIALDINLSDFKQTLKRPKALCVGLFSQLILLPLVSFLLVLLLKPQASIALGLILVASCPGGNVSNYFSALAKGNVTLSISMTVVTSLLALVFTPLNFAFYASKYPAAQGLLETIVVDPLSIAQTMTIIILIPVGMGILMKQYFPSIAQAVHRILKYLSIVLMMGIIVGAIYVNRGLFFQYINVIFFLVLIHNLLALSVGYLSAYFSGLDPKERKTISIETGIQNSALGLVLIFSFFDGLGGMAMIVGWWGVWHLISGFTFALISLKMSR